MSPYTVTNSLEQITFSDRHGQKIEKQLSSPDAGTGIVLPKREEQDLIDSPCKILGNASNYGKVNRWTFGVTKLSIILNTKFSSEHGAN